LDRRRRRAPGVASCLVEVALDSVDAAKGVLDPLVVGRAVELGEAEQRVPFQPPL